MSNYAKLKTNLKVAIQRLKLLEKKKTELSLKSRKEIADYIAMNKADRARIRVEHIIREDNYVEAMEILEMYCDLILARFGLIERMKTIDPGLDESVSTILWSTPRISNDIQEFQTISDILTHKYGRPYVEAAKTNASNNVNPKVIKRLGLEAPTKLLVEQYLIEIAKNFNVKYDPDPEVMLSSGLMSQELIDLSNQVNDIVKRNDNNSNGNGGNGGSSGGAAAGFMPQSDNFNSNDKKQIPSASIGFDDLNVAGSRSNDNLIDLGPPLPKRLPTGDSSSSPPPGYNGSNNNGFDFNSTPDANFHNSHNLQDSSKAKESEKNLYDSMPQPNINNNIAPTYFNSPPPSYNNHPSAPANHANNDDDFVIDFPAVPSHLPSGLGNNQGGSGRSNQQDQSSEYEDLQKRFFNLKKS